ncbi:MAG: hypothetical protein HW388_1581 [Dehalococcoidia bacterium]|nr:hypothetical protein [Dehalococcoidia bacterium]
MEYVVVIGGIVIVVVGYFAARAAVRAHCGRVERAYQSDPEAAATLYGYPAYAAWLAAQSWIVRWFA